MTSTLDGTFITVIDVVYVELCCYGPTQFGVADGTSNWYKFVKISSLELSGNKTTILYFGTCINGCWINFREDITASRQTPDISPSGRR